MGDLPAQSVALVILMISAALLLLLISAGVTVIRKVFDPGDAGGGGKGFVPGKTPVRYHQVKAFLTPAERSFYGVLQSIIPSTWQLFCKVRLADVVTPPPGLSKSAWQKSFNAISSKHLDFVVCKADTLEIVLVVELDDRSHDQPSRQARDLFLDAALKSAEVLLLRVNVKRGYSPEQIKDAMMCMLRDGSARKLA